MLQILVKLGFRPERNPHLLQLLRASRGGTTVDSVTPTVLNFWGALEQHDLSEVQRYLRGGLNPNDRRDKKIFGFKDNSRRLPGRTPLEMVCIDGLSNSDLNVKIAVMLVSAGAKADGKQEGKERAEKFFLFFFCQA